MAGPTWNDVTLSASFAWTGPLAEWSRWIPATDGSNFDGDTDYFLDVAMPLSEFRASTGLTPADGFQLALTTSTSHTQLNKDFPLGLGPTSPVASGFAPAPEPGSGLLTGLGLWLLAARARARRAG